ncbi:efflux RND transporter periplasmic adaptor subunit [Flavitalea sp. BT771]|uniref:efflux RND transporter periplasmic adaptor subunit n=1 Tax=Flavitalea sp. BT771 TaxID=3063329 RepID=UPI0026E303D9|nr:efflux RND transporter periplasmic adaptor subunit [Flavitalea sp. BT771]MDO6431194.1 efflux RND transporter periplasmic adaptor subunit [Flavitalea sp. BT771]MDV6220101.1 efflux RND transporter periplasmic adaptor subunit [Flavitalea sp. BT771]
MNYTFKQYAAPFIIVSSALLFFALSGCTSGAEAPAAEKGKYVLPDSLARNIKLDSVVNSRVVNSITLTGKVTFNEDNVAKIYPLVSGNITDIKVMLGDYVQQGQTLAVIRSGEMAGYSNDLITAETNVAVARKNLEATKDMYRSGLASARDSIAAQAGYDQATAALHKAQQVLQLNGGSRNGQYQVKTPISGFVVEKLATNNMSLRPDNSSNLFTISDLKNIWVIANVYESSIALIKPGDSVNVTTLSYPDKVFRGKVDKIMNVLDPTNKVMKVRIVLANPGYLLKPEMFANVMLNNKENKQMLSVPSTALIFDHSQYYVLVYKSPSDITIRAVQVSGTIGDKTYISEGLSEGEKVIGSQALLIYQELNS